MALSLLDTAKYRNPNVVLICTKSATMQNYMFDRLDSVYTHQSDALIHIEKTTDVSNLKDITNILPPFSDKWYVFTNVDKIEPSVIIPWVYKTKTTCFHIIFCEEYKNYKKCLDSFVKSKALNYLTFYLQYCSFKDFIYLQSHTKTALTKELNTKLTKYVYNYYSNNLESIWAILNQINNGVEITNTKQIEDICGLPEIHTDSYIIKLLSVTWSDKPKGLKTQIRNQIKLGKGIGDSLGFDTLYNFLNTSIKTLIDFKSLMLTDIIQINDLKRVNSKNFDIIRLKRLMQYYDDIEKIPMSNILQLASLLGNNKWKDETDFFSFIYNFINIKKKVQIL